MISSLLAAKHATTAARENALVPVKKTASVAAKQLAKELLCEINLCKKDKHLVSKIILLEFICSYCVAFFCFPQSRGGGGGGWGDGGGGGGGGRRQNKKNPNGF